MYNVTFFGFSKEKEIIAKFETVFDHDDFTNINPIEFIRQAHPNGKELDLHSAFISVTIAASTDKGEPNEQL